MFKSTKEALKIFRTLMYMIELQHDNFVRLIDVKISCNEENVLIITDYAGN